MQTRMQTRSFAQNYPERAAPPGPRFGGIVDSIANIVGKIDGNEFVQLIFLDGAGMIAPRTMAEAIKRGPDAARETGIREVSGLVGNMFLAGWFSHLMLKLLANRVNFYNPTGIPGKAWINAKNLEAFGTLYHGILKDPRIKNQVQAREELIRQFLKGLVSTNPELGKAALIDWANANLEGEARKNYLAATQARRESAIQRLQKHLRLKDLGSYDISGTSRLSEHARKIVDAEALQAKLGNKFFDQEKAYIKERLRLSLENLNGTGKKLITLLDQVALDGYLSNRVDLYGPEKILDGKISKPLLVANKKRHTIFQDFVHYLEQGVDRAADTVTDTTHGWQDEMENALFSPTKKKGLLAKILPQADEGLFTSLRKSKFAYTAIPVFMAVVGSIAVAFYNNWLTQKKHGGKLFSPFEGGPPSTLKAPGQKSGNKPGAPPSLSEPVAGGSALINRGAFARFQHNQHAAASGGGIA